MFHLFKEVQKMGGHEAVTREGAWVTLAQNMRFVTKSLGLQDVYFRYLADFEVTFVVGIVAPGVRLFVVRVVGDDVERSLCYSLRVAELQATACLRQVRSKSPTACIVFFCVAKGVYGGRFGLTQA